MSAAEHQPLSVEGRDLDRVEGFLDAVLRGAAKTLACEAANLFLFDERSASIRIRVGAMADSYPVLSRVEGVMGGPFRTLALPMALARGSLVYRCWRDRAVRETSSVAEILGGGFPAELARQLTAIVGDLRFLCVPLLAGSANYGVLVYAREGAHSYSREQREALLRYARTIGEIIANDVMGAGQSLFSLPTGDRPVPVVVDAAGRPVAWPEGDGVPAPLQRPAVQAAVAARLAEGGGGSPLVVVEEAVRIHVTPLAGGGAVAAVCAVERLTEGGDPSLKNHLLRLTLGDPAPTLFVDRQFRVTSLNDVAERVLGHAEARIRGRPVASIFQDPGPVLDLLGQQLAGAARTYGEMPTTIVCRDGSLRRVQVKTLALASDAEDVLGFMLLLREDRHDEAAGASYDRLAALGEMAAHLVHEVRNPLVAMGATLDGLRREPGLSVEQRATVAGVVREIERLDLTLRAFMGGSYEMAMAPKVRVASLVAETLSLLDGALRGREGVDVDVPDDLTVRGDHDALKQIIFNLLVNAIEASPGGGAVRLRAAEDSGGRVAIIVEDRGRGLGASAEECFRPFFTTKPNGTGLGLAVCQKLARAHGGVVELKPRAGGGCRATLILPRLGAAAGTEP